MATRDPFIAKAEAELHRLRERRADLGEPLASLQAQALELDTAIRRAESGVAFYRSLMGDEPGPAAARRRRSAGGTIADLVAEVMHQWGGSANTADLVRHLQERGDLAEKKSSAYNSVASALVRHPEMFRRVSTGNYVLVQPPGDTVASTLPSSSPPPQSANQPQAPEPHR